MLFASSTAATGARQLLHTELMHLHQKRYVVVPEWLCSAATAGLQVDALAVDKHSGIDCFVGTRQSNTVRVDRSIRDSRTCAFYPPPSNAVGDVEARAGLIDAVNRLRNELQRSVLMGLPYLEPFHTELNYLLYPKGGHYMRHLDQPQAQEGWTRQGRQAVDGGSLCGGHTRRVISFILYLNRNWAYGDGGALRVFPARQDQVAGTDPSTHVEDILPEGGTLVILMSGDVEHLVRETARERQCVVGWFREHCHGRVPDLDAMSLRTHRLLSKRATVDLCLELAATSSCECSPDA